MDTTCINTIRTLSMDAVQAANSGHPGTPMALAPVAYYLWQHFLRFDPQDPIWPNRDRFVLSAGHASMLLYSLLHLTGVKAVSKDYETLGEPSVPLDDDQEVPPARQQVPRATRSTAGPAASRPPPARSARAWPTASAWPSPARWLAAHFNRPGFEDLFDFNVYALCGDGGMMEGISHRGRLARRPPEALEPLLDLRQQPHHHRGQHRLTFSEDVAARFIGYGWNVTRVGDANDLDLLDAGLPDVPEHERPADPDHRRQPHRLGRPDKQDTSAAHGEPLGEEEIRLTKQFYGWPEDAKFLVPDGVYEHFQRGHRQARQGAPRRLVRASSTSTRRSIPTWPTSSTGCSTASSPTAGTRTCRPSRPTPRGMATPRARRARCSTPSPRTSPG